MEKQQAKDLVNKYVEGKATTKERELLDQWFYKNLESNTYKPDLESLEKTDEEVTRYLTSYIKAHPHETKTISLWPRIAAVASILIFLSLGIYFVFKKNDFAQITNNTIHDIAPGSKKAILTLANGKTIVLDNSQKGLLARQVGSAINKSLNGELIYQQDENNENASTVAFYNSITIPRGAEYQVVVLSDGTKVWINSASSLRYPTAFATDERKVELTGEAYFEVAHNAAKPFKVVTNNQTIEVLGTHFNINAYDDELAVKTTLLEGKVKVTAKSTHDVRYLLPGQQAALTSVSFTVEEAQTEEAVAWKNDRFMFEGFDIESIMRMVSRWYNVEIVYNGPIPKDTFAGATSRLENVSQVLNILELTGKVHFKIEGRRITVSKNQGN